MTTPHEHGTDSHIHPQHPDPNNLDVNFSPVVDGRQPFGPGDGGFRSSTRKPWYHSTLDSPYSDVRVNILAYEPIDISKPKQDLCFTSPDLPQYFSTEIGRVPDEYTSAEYVKWVINSHSWPAEHTGRIGKLKKSRQRKQLELPTDIDTIDIAATLKRASASKQNGTIDPQDATFLDALRAVATDHFISDGLTSGRGAFMPYTESDPDKTAPRAIPIAIRKIVQAMPYLDEDIKQGHKMGKHLAKTRADGAHFVQMDAGTDPVHPGLKLSDKDEAQKQRREKAREHASHELESDAKYFVQQAFRRAPNLLNELTKAVSRNKQADFDNLTPFTGPDPNSPEKEKPRERITFKYTELPGTPITSDKYVDAWGVVHKHGDSGTFTWNPNNQTLTDGIGQLFVSFSDTTTRMHTPGGVVEVEGVMEPEQAISLRRQLVGAIRYTGHLVMKTSINASPLPMPNIAAAPLGYKFQTRVDGQPYLVKE